MSGTSPPPALGVCTEGVANPVTCYWRRERRKKEKKEREERDNIHSSYTHSRMQEQDTAHTERENVLTTQQGTDSLPVPFALPLPPPSAGDVLEKAPTMKIKYALLVHTPSARMYLPRRRAQTPCRFPAHHACAARMRACAARTSTMYSP